MPSHFFWHSVETHDSTFRPNRPAHIIWREADCIKIPLRERIPGFSTSIHAVRAHSKKRAGRLQQHVYTGTVSGRLLPGELPGFSPIMSKSRCSVRLVWLFVVSAEDNAIFSVPKRNRKNPLAGRPMRDRSL